MPIIVPDEAYAAGVINKIMERYLSKEGRSGKWHVSDMMFPRYAIFSRLTNRKPTRRDVGFFFTGEAYHEFLQKVLGDEFAEVRSELFNVLATADYFDGDTLLEIKTSRKWTIPEMPQDNYIEQAKHYCTIFGKPSAKILVIFPVAGRKWDGSASSTVEVVSWNISFSDKEIEENKLYLQDMVAKLDKAFTTRDKADIEVLMPCPSWKYGSLTKEVGKEARHVLNVDCEFAKMCPRGCETELIEEMTRKNGKLDGKSAKGSALADRYK
jgi:hypothetical protein